jgi:Tol biopolymer transport system component
MKSRIFLNVFLVLSIFMFLSANIQQTAEQLYQSGIYKEEVEGDLEKAIAIYEQILKDFPENKSTAAKALYHIGLCYEKLGNQEAKKAYQRLIKEYPGQIQEVNLAKERLASLAKAAETFPNKPTFQKVRIPTKLSWTMQLSPDGQKVSLVSDKKLWIMPLSGKLGSDFPGAPVILNTDNVDVEWSGHAWSADCKWIAFNEVHLKEEKEGNQSIYIVSAEGGKPKKIYENYRDARVCNYRLSLSPHGKTLAFSSVDLERNEQHIYTIPVDSGVPKQLVDALAREPVFSPDGKMIAYVEDKNLGRGGGGLWVVPSQGGNPKHVADAKVASSPVWSPGGDMIAFVDYRDKFGKIHIIPIGKDGEAAGEKVSIDVPEGIQEVRLLAGWTPDNKIGAIFVSFQEFALYTLPAIGGKATVVAHGGYPTQPRWSSDGKQIFHTNVAEKGSSAWLRQSIAFVSAEGGKFSTIPIQSDAKIQIPGWGAGNRISPDGKMIVFAGKTPKDSGLHMHIWIFPVEGGKPKQLTEAPAQSTDMFPCWSPDGKAVAFVRARVPDKYVERFSETNIFILNVSGGEPKSLTSESCHVNFSSIAWSPDGKLLAYFSRDEDSSDGTLNVIPVNGGEPHVVGKVHSAHVNKELAWSPDSKRIAFNGSNDKVIKVISVEDGRIVDVQTDLVDTNIYHLDWSPDGKKFVFGGYKGGNREFWLMEDFLPLVKRQK